MRSCKRFFHARGFDNPVSMGRQHACDMRPRCGPGIGQQNRAVARFPIELRLRLVNRRRLVRQESTEGRSPHRIAFGPNAPRVLLDDRPANGESESAPPLLPRVGSVHLLEAPKDRLQLVRRYAAALVNH